MMTLHKREQEPMWARHRVRKMRKIRRYRRRDSLRRRDIIEASMQPGAMQVLPPLPTTRVEE